MGEVRDDYLHDIIWELGCGGRFVRGTRVSGRTTGEAIGLGSSSVPGGNHAGREVYRWGVNGVGIRTVYAH